MDYENVLGERLIPTYEELKSGLLRLIDEGKISREDAARVLPELRESESERVRKAIDEILKLDEVLEIAGKYHLSVVAIRGGLTKQKEQKPVDDDNPLDNPRFIDGFDTGREVQKIFDEPTKWSEKDEKMLKCCLIAINHYEKTCNIGDHLPTKFNIDGYLASVDKVKSWLKSLLPGWKPTEEQMEALNAMNCYGELSYQGQQQLLIDLYQQLKKL